MQHDGLFAVVCFRSHQPSRLAVQTSVAPRSAARGERILPGPQLMDCHDDLKLPTQAIEQTARDT